jgi:hypothetical protein
MSGKTAERYRGKVSIKKREFGTGEELERLSMFSFSYCFEGIKVVQGRLVVLYAGYGVITKSP